MIGPAWEAGQASSLCDKEEGEVGETGDPCCMWIHLPDKAEHCFEYIYIAYMYIYVYVCVYV